MSVLKASRILQPLLFAVLLIALISCSNHTTSAGQIKPHNQIARLNSVILDPKKIVTGQTVYVPIYSHIYFYNKQDSILNLSATLSIRNTDMQNTILITTLRYYDTNGKLIREFLNNPVELKPLASTDVFIGANDITGGLGANFIVDWVAEKTVYEPVIEAVMISTESAQGISFISPGRVLKSYSPKN